MEEKNNRAFTKVNFDDLIKLVYELQDEVILLKDENDSLKAQQKTDSHNSSKPPSSDGLARRNINLRKSSIKSMGGQIGHKVQYGVNIKSLLIYFKDYHFIPYQRLAQLFKDCFSVALSPGTLSNFTRKSHETLGPFEELVKEKLQESPVIHSNETGIRSEGKTHWVHVASNEHLTRFHFDPKREKEAIERSGILPNYTGTLTHDRFSPYFNYHYSHGLCNAHILREFIFLEELGHQWSKKTKILLLNAKDKDSVTKTYITRTKNEYKNIIRDELAKQPKIKSKNCRGKPKRTKSHNLLITLNKYNREILAFLSEPDIPFDNNLAERDIRIVKTIQKVSSCFRSQQGGHAFARVRSFASTLNKQSRNVFLGFKQLFTENPDFKWIAE